MEGHRRKTGPWRYPQGEFTVVCLTAALAVAAAQVICKQFSRQSSSGHALLRDSPRDKLPGVCALMGWIAAKSPNASWLAVDVATGRVLAVFVGLDRARVGEALQTIPNPDDALQCIHKFWDEVQRPGEGEGEADAVEGFDWRDTKPPPGYVFDWVMLAVAPELAGKRTGVLERVLEVAVAEQQRQGYRYVIGEMVSEAAFAFLRRTFPMMRVVAERRWTDFRHGPACRLVDKEALEKNPLLRIGVSD